MLCIYERMRDAPLRVILVGPKVVCWIIASVPCPLSRSWGVYGRGVVVFSFKSSQLRANPVSSAVKVHKDHRSSMGAPAPIMARHLLCVCVCVCVWVLLFLPRLPGWTYMATLASSGQVTPHYSRPSVQARGASVYCPSTSAICT